MGGWEMSHKEKRGKLATQKRGTFELGGRSLLPFHTLAYWLSSCICLGTRGHLCTPPFSLKENTTISFQREGVPLEAEESAQDLPLLADAVALCLGWWTELCPHGAVFCQHLRNLPA